MTDSDLIPYLKMHLELGGSEVFFDEAVLLPQKSATPVAAKITPAKAPSSKVAPVEIAAHEPYSPPAAPVPKSPQAPSALLVPDMAKRTLGPGEDMTALEAATSLEAFHEAVMHHPFYRLGVGAAGRIAFGIGPMHPPLMLVGLAPTEEDLRSGGFYSGAPSELLRKLLESLSHSRNLCYATWLVKKPISSVPLPRQMSILRRMLQLEVNLVKPELILFLGEPTYQAVMTTNALLHSTGGAPMEFAGTKATAIFDPIQLNETPALKSVTWKLHLPKSGFFRQMGL